MSKHPKKQDVTYRPKFTNAELMAMPLKPSLAGHDFFPTEKAKRHIAMTWRNPFNPENFRSAE